MVALRYNADGSVSCPYREKCHALWTPVIPLSSSRTSPTTA